MRRAVGVAAMVLSACGGDAGGIVASTFVSGAAGSNAAMASGASGASGHGANAGSGNDAGAAAGSSGAQAGGSGTSGASGTGGTTAIAGQGGAPGQCVPMTAGANDDIPCPGPLVGTPYPDPDGIARFRYESTGAEVVGIDGHTWIDPKLVDPASTKNWRWSVVGGPCDDILPNPSFAVFPSEHAVWSAHLGTKEDGLPLEPDAPPTGCDPATTCGAFPSKTGIKRGWVIESGESAIFPAFSQSGDYYVTGRFTYVDPVTCQETERQCTQVVKVRAPGIRVELCWPEVGPNKDDDDVDLHFARLDGATAGPHGWFTTAGEAPPLGQGSDDCDYSSSSGCANRVPTGQDPATYGPAWGYADTAEPSGFGVCHGWGGHRFGSVAGAPYARPCTNPRLDRDDAACDPTVTDPHAIEVDPSQKGAIPGNFCGSENIALDAPNAGDRFAIGVHCYGCVGGTNASLDKRPAHPRVNVYCNGELKIGFGYEPAETAKGTPQYPQLLTEGGPLGGAFWNVAIVWWSGNAQDPCGIDPVVAQSTPDADGWHDVSDGPGKLCVQNGEDDAHQLEGSQSPTPGVDGEWPWPNGGAIPTSASGLCPY